LDEGRWALAQNHWADALTHSRAAAKLLPQWPPPRNNVSTAFFHLGRYPEAISEAKAVLQDCDPDNLHAQANLVRYHVITGDLGTADRYAECLARLPLPDDAEGVVKQIEGLAFRDRDADIDRILTAARKRFGELPAVAYVHWGIAKANAGQRREALAHLRRARECEDTALLRSTLDALERRQPGPGISDRYPQTHFVDLIALGAVEEAGRQLVRDEKQGSRDRWAWGDLLRRYPQLPLVVSRMLYEVPASTGPMAQLLAGLRTPEAVETLHGFVSGQLGSREDRMQVLLIMQQTGVLPPGTQIEMWVDGERHPIQSVLQTISDEFVPDYSPKVWDLYGRALTAHREGRIAEAERLYEAMLRAEPNAKEAYNNLASIYHQRGDLARADEYMDKALAIDPFYPFPHTSRASQALAKGDLTAAKAWLEPLHIVQKWHPLGFITYQKAMARVAIEEKEYKTAREHLEMTKQFVEHDPEVEDLLNWLSLAGLTGQFGDWFQEHDERSRQRRLRKPLPADPTLADCLQILSKGDMDGIAGVVGLRLRHPYRKADIEQLLLTRFPDPDFLAGLVRDLNEAERAALDDLLVHGGVMEREAFIQAHGDEGDDRPYLEYHGSQMKSVKGRLRAHGLLFEGSSRERAIVATPRELRPLLQQALDSVT
jgi:tetratricopeptide (TPR) repeat protein